jgi:hypothetical protein
MYFYHDGVRHVKINPKIKARFSSSKAILSLIFFAKQLPSLTLFYSA